MSTPITPEVRTQIVTAIKGGMSITEAATTNNIAASTIRKWLRDISNSTRSSSNELQKARRRIQFLEQVILDLVLEQKSQAYKG
jgi:transposase-like protein